ncbi:MAG TPA: helix-turn-helix transcriptional regulator [Streptosporangiaceae bacterium]|nr:helix-turn-helix transcriptional regulator [Streptosporangiaceae bacterium]
MRDRFGAELRRWRTERRLTQRSLARQVWHSQESVAKIEKGERWPSQDFAVHCDRVLGTGGVLAGLWPAVERERLVCDRRRSAATAADAG